MVETFKFNHGLYDVKTTSFYFLSVLTILPTLKLSGRSTCNTNNKVIALASHPYN